LSVPGKGPELADCLLARVQAAFPDALLVHRLDRDTSGVMIFALTRHAQRHLGLQFEKRMTRKTYVARQMVCHETGRAAQTEWRLLGTDGQTSKVRLHPKTGRSHQLRVHMLAMGHVILGDPIYAEGAALAFPRLMLHSEELRFKHPQGGRSVKIRSVAPF